MSESKKDLSWLPEGKKPLADGEYDAIIMGTGLKECIIGGLLSVRGMRVLQVDRNNYYGGDCASLNLSNLWKKFRGTEQFPPSLGQNRDWNVDLIPKFIMANGKLVKILLHTKVERYLELMKIDGSYVFKDKKIHKVPATPDEALSTGLVGMFEKLKYRSFLGYVHGYDEANPSTYSGYDLHTMTGKQLFEKYGLSKNTMTFTGHSLALMLDDDYLDQPAIGMVRAIQLYVQSLQAYGSSPYIYTLYGLGSLPEAFSRLCAVNNGTFMLNTPVDEIMYKDGAAWGIRCGDEVAKGTFLIGDPSYFPESKLLKTGAVVRSIFILDHTIPNTKDSKSVQIIIPGSSVGRKSDIYLCMVSHALEVCSEGKYVAIASTQVETSDPIKELDPAVNLIGKYLERFDEVKDSLEPVSDGTSDRCFISKSYDATSHFDTTSIDVLEIYERCVGEVLDLNIERTEEDY